MGRHKTNRTQCTIRIDPDIWPAIEFRMDKNEIINRLLRENIDRIGNYTEQDKLKLIHNKVKSEADIWINSKVRKVLEDVLYADYLIEEVKEVKKVSKKKVK